LFDKGINAFSNSPGRSPSRTNEDIYVESGLEGVRFLPLRVADDGDFLDRWPQGFFEERAEELF
jgi:hypothetical protein